MGESERTERRIGGWTSRKKRKKVQGKMKNKEKEEPEQIRKRKGL